MIKVEGSMRGPQCEVAEAGRPFTSGIERYVRVEVARCLTLNELRFTCLVAELYETGRPKAAGGFVWLRGPDTQIVEPLARS